MEILFLPPNRLCRKSPVFFSRRRLNCDMTWKFPKDRMAIVIVGPTGVGKTAFSRLIAEKLPVEIVSADSRQIYRYMDIGTAKPAREFLEAVPHHFIDILDPDQPYSAGEFGQQARRTVLEIFSRDRIPLIVGGSGLYLRALLHGFFGDDYKNPELRQQLTERAEKEGAEALYRELEQIDPAAAAGIHPNNVKRVIRALEVAQTAGVPLSQLQQNVDPAPFRWRQWGLTARRELLYRRIDRRVEEMFRAGLISEVRGLLERGYSQRLNSLNSVGYKEVIALLEGRLSEPACREVVQRNSRRYAKRQLTWFRADPEIEWIDISEKEALQPTAEKIVSAVSGL